MSYPPRLLKEILAILQENPDTPYSKYELADLVGCNQRSAQRMLMTLRADNLIRVAGHQTGRGRYLPFYVLTDGKPDSVQPVTGSAIKEQKRQARIKQVAVLSKHLHPTVTYGFWAT